MIVPLFSIAPVVGAVVLSPIYPAAIPTLNNSFDTSDAPTVIVPLFLPVPPLTMYIPKFPTPFEKSIFPELFA